MSAATAADTSLLVVRTGFASVSGTSLACAGIVSTRVVRLITNHLRRGFFILGPGEGHEYVMMLTLTTVAVAGVGPAGGPGQCARLARVLASHSSPDSAALRAYSRCSGAQAAGAASHAVSSGTDFLIELLLSSAAQPAPGLVAVAGATRLRPPHTSFP